MKQDLAGTKNMDYSHKTVQGLGWFGAVPCSKTLTAPLRPCSRLLSRLSRFGALMVRCLCGLFVRASLFSASCYRPSFASVAGSLYNAPRLCLLFCFPSAMASLENNGGGLGAGTVRLRLQPAVQTAKRRQLVATSDFHVTGFV